MSCRTCRHSVRASVENLRRVLRRDLIAGVEMTLEHLPGVDALVERGDAIRHCRLHESYVEPADTCEHESLVVLGSLRRRLRQLATPGLADPDDVLRRRLREEARAAEEARRVEALAAPMVDIGAALQHCAFCDRDHDRCILCRQLRVECALCPHCGRKALVERSKAGEASWQCKHLCRPEARGRDELPPATWGPTGLCEACTAAVKEDPALLERAKGAA